MPLSVGNLLMGTASQSLMSAIASSYASGKQDALTFGYDGSVISSIDGSAIAGGGGGGDTSQCFPASASSMLQPSGDYAYNSSVSGKLDASASSQFYLSTNPSGFISSSYTPTFGYDGSKISSIDGSALVGEGAGTGIEYSGIAPVVVNNTSHEISADTINFVLDSSLSGTLSNSQYTLSINKEVYSPVQVVSSTSLATANGVIYVVSQ